MNPKVVLQLACEAMGAAHDKGKPVSYETACVKFGQLDQWLTRSGNLRDQDVQRLRLAHAQWCKANKYGTEAKRDRCDLAGMAWGLASFAYQRYAEHLATVIMAPETERVDRQQARARLRGWYVEGKSEDVLCRGTTRLLDRAVLDKVLTAMDVDLTSFDGGE